MRATCLLALLAGLSTQCGPRGGATSAPPRAPAAVRAEVPGADDAPLPSARAVAQIGHSMEIWAVAWNPSAELVATGSFDHTIRLWNAQGRMLGVLAGHREAITDLAWRGKGDVLASAARDGTVRLWDLHHAGKHRKLDHAGDHVAMSPDGARVASVGYDLVVRIYDVRSGSQERTLTAARGRQLRAIAWSPDGRLIAAGSLDGPLYVWDAETGAEVATGSAAIGPLGRLAFSPDSALVAASGRALTLFDVAKQTSRRLERAGFEAGQVSFSADGKHLVSDGSFGQIHVWNVATGKHEKTIPHPGYISAVACAPRGDRVAVGGKVPLESADGGNVELPVARVYTLGSGKEALSLEGSARPVTGAAWDSSGETLLTASPELALWDAKTGAKKGVLAPGGAVAAAWNPKLPLVALAGRGVARVLDLGGKELASLRAEEPTFVWAPDGSALGVRSESGVWLWNVARHTSTKLAVPLADAMVFDVVFTPDSKALVVATSNRVDAYDVASGKVTRSYLTDKRVPAWNRPESLVMAPNGMLAATLNGPGLALFGAGGKMVDFLPERSWFALPAFNHDGSVMAYCQKDDIVLWGARKGVFSGHDDVIRGIAWSPDEKLFASASDDQSIRLWRLGQSNPVRSFATYTGRVWSVAWHPSGKALLGVSNESEIHRLSDGVTLRMIVTPAAGAAAFYTDSGDYAGDPKALDSVLLRPSDDLLAPALTASGAEWKNRPELLSEIAR